MIFRLGDNFSDCSDSCSKNQGRAKEHLRIFLTAKCEEIDKVIATKIEQLALIDKYKKSLIYEYVTGKKEVPAI